MADRIQLRRGSQEEWEANSTEVLADGEIGIYRNSYSTFMFIGDGSSTINELILGDSISQIPLFKSNSSVYEESIDEDSIGKAIDFEVRIEEGDIRMRSQNYNNIYKDETSENLSFSKSLEYYNNLLDEGYGCQLYTTIESSNGIIDTVFLYLGVYNNEGDMSIEFDNEDGAIIIDSIFERGLGDAYDFSANKTELSYINKAWLRSISGYNASASQNLTHDASGNFLWVNV